MFYESAACRSGLRLRQLLPGLDTLDGHPGAGENPGAGAAADAPASSSHRLTMSPLPSTGASQVAPKKPVMAASLCFTASIPARASAKRPMSMLVYATFVWMSLNLFAQPIVSDDASFAARPMGNHLGFLTLTCLRLARSARTSSFQRSVRCANRGFGDARPAPHL